ncbi:MAG: DNA recombination/repair protein RecA [Spirochaetales bacterium]|nr:DNA recombination/repair protein RecA [Spirochaetales bacterium]
MSGLSSLRVSDLYARISEISQAHPNGGLTIAMSLVAQTIAAGNAVAWVHATDSIFYPPDVADQGIDPALIPVIRVQTSYAATKVADWLLRSDAFALIVVDLGEQTVVTDASLARLQHLVRRSGTGLVFLTIKPNNAVSLGSMVTYRGVVVSRVSEDGIVHSGLAVIKDKRRGPGARYEGTYDAPVGLR